MSKYIDAEKLIAKLKRQKRELELSIQSQGDYGQSCHIVAYENILSLITSLQQEQPQVADASKMEQPDVDIEEEITRTYHDGSVTDTDDMDHVDYENIARHFYELGLNARNV